MRILFTFVGGRGHLEPLVPLARAARAAGHAVAFGCPPAMAAAVAAAGFDAQPMGTARGDGPERRPLLPVDREREACDLREKFARDAARYRAWHAGELCAAWRPDVLVCDETDFGPPLVAERCGVPWATVAVTATGAFVPDAGVAPVLGALRGELGLPPDPAHAAPARHLVLSPFPASLRDPGHPLPPNACGFRMIEAAEPIRNDPATARPTVYFTLGTVFGLESGDLYARVVAGLALGDCQAIVTIGSHVDPADLGPLPPRVRVERFVPQAEVLPRCDAVVSHAGSGTLLGALAHGLPSVLVPMGADQPWNAERAEALGCACVLDPVTATPDDVCAAVTRALGDSALRASARRLQAEIAALPEPEEAVRRIAGVAVG